MKFIKHFPKNNLGNDYVVGDIHGMFTKLYDTLKNFGFDFNKDRLFSVGDLCDRGPDSEDVIQWLEYPWFFPVFGNHEEILIDYEKAYYNKSDLINVGAGWWLNFPENKKKIVIEKYKNLPIGIEVETSDGLVGIIHAECPHADWLKLDELLSGNNGYKMINRCLWSTMSPLITDTIQGVRAVIVGHMTQQNYIVNGNVHLIDTGAVYQNGYFTILNLENLEPVKYFD